MEIDEPVLDLLRMGAYQIHYMDSVPAYAAVSATVDQVTAVVGRRPAGFVNAVLRQVADLAPTAPEQLDSPEVLSGWGSHPEWLVRRWLARYSSDQVRQLLDHDNRRPSTCVVPLGMDAEQARDVLAGKGVETEPARDRERTAPQKRPGRACSSAIAGRWCWWGWGWWWC